MIVTVTGPSGVGKTTLFNGLLQRIPNAKALVSITTRAPRPTDESSMVYVSDDEFNHMNAQGEFVWEVHVHEKRYATPKRAVDDALQSGVSIAILTIEAVKILHLHIAKNNLPVTSLYIHIDDEAELRRRFAARGDMNAELIESRIDECRTWYEQAKKSGVPFIYLDGTLPRDALLSAALVSLGIHTAQTLS